MFIGAHVTAINLHGEEVTGVIEKILINTVIIRKDMDAVLIKKKEIKAIMDEPSIAKKTVIGRKTICNSEETSMMSSKHKVKLKTMNYRNKWILQQKVRKTIYSLRKYEN